MTLELMQKEARETIFEALKTFLENSDNIKAVRNISLELLDGKDYVDIYFDYNNIIEYFLTTFEK